MADPRTVSPAIRSLSWGRLEIEGLTAVFKDAKLYPGGARQWDWHETGTRHRPGIQPADVEELVARGARVVVLSRGMLGRLRIDPATLQELDRNRVGWHVLSTRKAVDLYNRLRETEAVGGLFHTTC
jgi:hypothetical protein